MIEYLVVRDFDYLQVSMIQRN